MQRRTKATVDLFRHVVSIANRGLGAEICLTELIDNALDADATDVSIDVVAGKRLRVRDNGVGIPNVDKLVEFGGHVAHGRDGSGIYGVGFKDAALCIGGEKSTVSVITVRRSDRLRTTCAIDWSALKSSEECMESDSAPMPDEPPGTEVVVEPIRLAFPDGERRMRLLDRLGYIYSPALKRGAKIRVTMSGKTTELVPWKLPQLVEHIDERFEVGNGLVRLKAGIVAPGVKNERPGLTYTHRYRVIKRGSRDGCGDWSPNRICGFVEVLKGWSRTTNKTDLVDAQDLYDAIVKRMEPMLRKAEEQSHNIELAGSMLALEGMLREAIVGPPNEKAKRGSGDATGTKLPANTGRKHRRARDAQPGATFGRQRVTNVKLEIIDGYEEDGVIGKWQPGKTGIVTLWRDHPFIARLVMPWNADALFGQAMAVIAASRKDDGGQVSMTSADEVLVSLADLTKIGVRLDGAALMSAAAE